MSFQRPNYKYRRVTVNTGDQLMTKQSHKDECDIHKILRQFQRTGIITHVQNARGTYEDLPAEVDFQEALHTMSLAQDAFAGLPSAVRDYFGNDPGRFLGSFSDTAQHEKLREFGLIKPLPPSHSQEPPAPPIPPAS